MRVDVHGIPLPERRGRREPLRSRELLNFVAAGGGCIGAAPGGPTVGLPNPIPHAALRGPVGSPAHGHR